MMNGMKSNCLIGFLMILFVHLHVRGVEAQDEVFLPLPMFESASGDQDHLQRQTAKSAPVGVHQDEKEKKRLNGAEGAGAGLREAIKSINQMEPFRSLAKLSSLVSGRNQPQRRILLPLRLLAALLRILLLPLRILLAPLIVLLRALRLLLRFLNPLFLLVVFFQGLFLVANALRIIAMIIVRILIRIFIRRRHEKREEEERTVITIVERHPEPIHWKPVHLPKKQHHKKNVKAGRGSPAPLKRSDESFCYDIINLRSLDLGEQQLWSCLRKGRAIMDELDRVKGLVEGQYCRQTQQPSNRQLLEDNLLLRHYTKLICHRQQAMK